MDYVYVVSYCASYEGEQLLGVFSDYVKAREFEVNYKARYVIGESNEWIEVRKVELNKVYEDMFAVGEEM
ncbi:hypothetical protein EB001_12735 [bacterium]|nr:hypothetical protein [bacterium]